MSAATQTNMITIITRHHDLNFQIAADSNDGFKIFSAKKISKKVTKIKEVWETKTIMIMLFIKSENGWRPCSIGCRAHDSTKLKIMAFL